jgi:hypothetical protein
MYVGPIRADIASIEGTGVIFPSDCFVVGIREIESGETSRDERT